MIGLAANQLDPKIVDLADYNDLYLNDLNDIATVDGIEAIQQTVNAHIWFLLADSDFNLTAGIPWFRLLGDTPIDYTLINYYLTQTILDVNNYIPDSEKPQLGIQDNIQIKFTENKSSGNLNADITYVLNNGYITNISTDGNTINTI